MTNSEIPAAEAADVDTPTGAIPDDSVLNQVVVTPEDDDGPDETETPEEGEQEDEEE